MPRDMHGRELRPGDIVMIECVVEDVEPEEFQLNCHLATTRPIPLGAGKHPALIACHSRLVSLVRSAALQPLPPEGGIRPRHDGPHANGDGFSEGRGEAVA